jgi:hypothetical protein
LQLLKVRIFTVVWATTLLSDIVLAMTRQTRQNRGDGGSQINQGESSMLVAKEHRERLNLYCAVRKVTQEVAVNEMIGEALERIEESDPLMNEQMNRVAELKAELASIGVNQ